MVVMAECISTFVVLPLGDQQQMFELEVSSLLLPRVWLECSWDLILFRCLKQSGSSGLVKRVEFLGREQTKRDLKALVEFFFWVFINLSFNILAVVLCTAWSITLETLRQQRVTRGYSQMQKEFTFLDFLYEAVAILSLFLKKKIYIYIYTIK